MKPSKPAVTVKVMQTPVSFSVALPAFRVTGEFKTFKVSIVGRNFGLMSETSQFIHNCQDSTGGVGSNPTSDRHFITSSLRISRWFSYFLWLSHNKHHELVGL